MLRLQYDAPAQCPPAAAVHTAAIRLAGKSPQVALHAKVRIERGERGYSALVVTKEGARQRLLLDPSCEAIAEAVEVLIALAIDPDAAIPNSVSGSAAMPRDVAPQVASPPSMGEVGQPQPAPAVPFSHASTKVSENARKKARAVLSVGAEVGALPKVAEFGKASFGLTALPHTWLMVAGKLWVKRRGEMAGHPNKGGEFSLWAVAASGCYQGLTRRSIWDLCVGTEAGRLSGDSFGMQSNGNGSAVWFAALASTAVRLPLSAAISLQLGAELAVPFIRRPFQLEGAANLGASQIYRPEPVSARFDMGFAWSIW